MVDLRLALPRRVRLRLWLMHHVDAVAIWLADHGRDAAAIRLWKLFRAW